MINSLSFAPVVAIDTLTPYVIWQIKFIYSLPVHCSCCMMGSWPLSSCSCIIPLPVTVSCVWNPPLKETSPTLSTYNMLSCQGYVDNLKGAGSQFLSKALFCFECFKWFSKVFLIVNQTLRVSHQVISEIQSLQIFV